MRVTCDLDTHNIFKVFYYILKGSIMFKRLPYMIRKTKRGFHYGWRGLNIKEKESYYYRLLLGDDLNRVLFDMSSDLRLKQVLFKEKEVYYYERDLWGNFVRKVRIQ